MNTGHTLSVAAVFWISVCAHAQTTWILASGYSDSSYHTVVLKEFAVDVAQRTQGRLQLDVRSNNSLVKLAEIRNAVGAGTVQAGEVILTGIAKEFSIAGADSIPFVVNSMSDAQRLWTKQRPALEKQLDPKGLKLLYSIPWPSQGLYSIRPIVAKRDFLGGQMRTYNATTVRIAEMLGAKPVDVPMVKVADALAEGRMESMISSAVTGVENKVWSHLKYFYEINAWTAKNAVLVNRAAFDRLAPDDQRIVMQAAESAQERGWKLSQQVAQLSLQTLKSNGMKVEAMPPSLIPTFTALGESFAREWVREAGVPALEMFIAYFLKTPDGPR